MLFTKFRTTTDKGKANISVCAFDYKGTVVLSFFMEDLGYSTVTVLNNWYYSRLLLNSTTNANDDLRRKFVEFERSYATLAVMSNDIAEYKAKAGNPFYGFTPSVNQDIFYMHMCNVMADLNSAWDIRFIDTEGIFPKSIKNTIKMIDHNGNCHSIMKIIHGGNPPRANSNVSGGIEFSPTPHTAQLDFGIPESLGWLNDGLADNTSLQSVVKSVTDGDYVFYRSSCLDREGRELLKFSTGILAYMRNFASIPESLISNEDTALQNLTNITEVTQWFQKNVKR